MIFDLIDWLLGNDEAIDERAKERQQEQRDLEQQRSVKIRQSHARERREHNRQVDKRIARLREKIKKCKCGGDPPGCWWNCRVWYNDIEREEQERWTSQD